MKPLQESWQSSPARVKVAIALLALIGAFTSATLTIVATLAVLGTSYLRAGARRWPGQRWWDQPGA